MVELRLINFYPLRVAIGFRSLGRLRRLDNGCDYRSSHTEAGCPIGKGHGRGGIHRNQRPGVCRIILHPTARDGESGGCRIGGLTEVLAARCCIAEPALVTILPRESSASVDGGGLIILAGRRVVRALPANINTSGVGKDGGGSVTRTGVRVVDVAYQRAFNLQLKSMRWNGVGVDR